jgi:hypothetical protein
MRKSSASRVELVILRRSNSSIFSALLLKKLNKNKQQQKCLDEEKEERDLEREVPSAIARFFVTISKALPSQPFLVVSSVFQALFTKSFEVFSEHSLKTSFAILYPSLSMLVARL